VKRLLFDHLFRARENAQILSLTINIARG